MVNHREVFVLKQRYLLVHMKYSSGCLCGKVGYTVS